MKISAITKLSRKASDSLVLAYFAKEKFSSHLFFKLLKNSEKRLVEQYFKNNNFSAKQNEVKVLPRVGQGKILLVGLGEKGKWNLRRAVLVARQIVVVAKAEKILQLSLPFDNFVVVGVTDERLGQTVAENAVMANYEFTQYRTKPEKVFSVSSINFFTLAKSYQAVQKGIEVGLIMGEQVNLARDLGNIPGGEMTPKLLAEKARQAGKQNKFKVRILDVTEIKRLKMGAILGVAKGSAEQPRFIIMEYNGGKKSQRPLVFVGKGVTFDTGGLNLKPGKNMNDMHLDMLGGAAVIAALSAIAKLKLPANVVGLVPAVENMPGNAGYRPGDLLRSMSGKTIEIQNTDAEGRVILADALTYAERFNPEVVLDIATLTGACMVALGLQASGLMTTSSSLQAELMAVGESSGDYVWPLPMWEEYEDEVKGTFGDVQNDGKNSPYGGAIAGAMFLKQFVGKALWAHLDIAGPMKTFDGQFLAKGASGVGVRLLVEFARKKFDK